MQPSFEGDDTIFEEIGDKGHDPRAELLKLARAAPRGPGVYLMKDQLEEVLYVGKAKVLSNRIPSYFQKVPHEVGRLELLVRRVVKFEVVLTETEQEALVLECTLIKKYRPKFNIRLKDDKTYPSIRINLSDEYPKLEWTRRVLSDGSKYFGPFPSAYSARETMKLINETMRLRDCSDNTFRHRSRPCILYQMEKCSAPCVGFISPDQYRESIMHSIAVLEGRDLSVRKQLRAEMKAASAAENYERAAVLRDQMQSLEVVTQTKSFDPSGNYRHLDVIAVEASEGIGHGVVLQVRFGRVVAVKHIQIQNTYSDMRKQELLSQFILQYYGILGEQVVSSQSNLVLVSEAPEDFGSLELGLGLSFMYPKEEGDQHLVRVAETNAKYALEEHKKKSTTHGLEALEEVRKILHLENMPRRIECYDISNIHGQDPVASRVVFIDGEPEKNLYRKYHIKTVVGSNDFAMMKEVLGRRFANEEEALPDLIVVDGGKGQLKQATTILQEYDRTGIAVVGLAKARTESDFTQTEVKSSAERIFLPNRTNPVILRPSTKSYKILTHIRDEAHRFAITFHRKTRAKRVPKS